MSRSVLPRFTVSLAAAVAVVSWLASQTERCHAQAPLGFNNVVVLQSGTGPTNNATATSLQEFTPGGSSVQTITVPSSGTGTKLTNVGSTSTEGTLSVSPDGRWIAFGGYDAIAGTSSVASGTTSARVAGILNTTTGTYSLTPMGSGFRVSSGAAIRGVATNDGNSIWGIGSSQGLVYGSVSGGTASFGSISSGIATGYNAIGVFSGTSTDLFASCSSGTNPRVGSFGPTALPTGTATSFTALSGSPPTATTTSGGFVFLDVNPAVPGIDTLYVTDVSANSTGGIWKYSLGLSGTWAGSQLISGTTGLTLRGLAGFVSGSNVRLFVTSTSSLYTYWDADAATSSSLVTVANLTSIATAPTGVQFRGVAVVPEPSSSALLGFGSVALGGAEWVRRRRSRRRRTL